jgi:hypothetical protein
MQLGPLGLTFDGSVWQAAMQRKIRQDLQDVRSKGQGGHRVSKQAGLFSHSLTPMPAAAPHRLPPSEALSEPTEKAILLLGRMNNMFDFSF